MQPLPSLRYWEFRILLEEASKGRIHVTLSTIVPGPDEESSAAGQEPVSGEFELPVTSQSVARAVATASRSSEQYVARSQQADLLDPLRELGATLFSALFQGRRKTFFDRSLASAKDADVGLRLRIVTSDEAADNLDWIPWEFLYDSRRQDFVALSMRTPVVRQRGSEVRPMTEAGELPLRVLVVGADVCPSLGVETQIRKLRSLFATHEGLIAPTFREHATGEDFLAEVKSGNYDALHFIGTGIDLGEIRPPASAAPRTPGLVLLDREGREGGQVIWQQDLLGAVRQQSRLRLVILDACHTDALVSALAQHVPMALGLRGLASVDGCAAFTLGLYRSLLRGAPMESAVTAARQELDQALPGGREWGLLTLYLQIPEGTLAVQTTEEAHAEPSDFSPKQAVLGEADRQRRILAIKARILQENVQVLEAQAGGPVVPDFVRKQLDHARLRLQQLQAPQA